MKSAFQKALIVALLLALAIWLYRSTVHEERVRAAVEPIAGPLASLEKVETGTPSPTESRSAASTDAPPREPTSARILTIKTVNDIQAGIPRVNLWAMYEAVPGNCRHNG